MPAGLNDAWCPSPPPSVTDEPLPQTVQPPLPTITADQVRGELRKTVNACLKLSKRGEPLQHGFNLSLQLGRVPVLWKTLFFHPSSQEGPPQCAEWLQASCLDVTYDDLGMATQGLHSPRQGKQCWEDYVLWCHFLLRSLAHLARQAVGFAVCICTHPAPPKQACSEHCSACGTWRNNAHFLSHYRQNVSLVWGNADNWKWKALS